ncbi:L,D-transpeptidase [bacterium]|nr:L,D-transpeptidase [bacterium]
MCVTIDRNPAVQAMIVYDSNGNIKYKYPVSTGRETFDIPTNFNKTPSGCSTTPTGTFKPQLMREHHYSNTWLVKNPETGKYEDGALMGWSTFFTNNGHAIHAAGTKEAAAALGPKLPGDMGTGSGGCVRLFPWDARTLFDEIVSCEKTETKKVCIEREISLPTARTDKNENVVRVPKCLKMAEQPVCVDYNAPSPQCNAEQVQLRVGQCVDPKQFPVVKKADKSFAIKITDSRPKAEIDAIRAKCEKDKDIYYQRKAECIVEKAPSQFNAQQTEKFNTIKRTQAGTRGTDGEAFYKAFLGIYNTLDSNARSRIEYSCNEQLYNEAAAAKAQKNPGGAVATGNSAETPALAPPQPKKRGFFGWLGSIFSKKDKEREGQ